MKYKLKFEIDYTNQNKQEARESKINSIINDDSSIDYIYEIESSDKVPPCGSKVILSDMEFYVNEIKYKYDNDCCTYILLIIPIEEAFKEKSAKDDLINKQALHSLISYASSNSKNKTKR